MVQFTLVSGEYEVDLGSPSAFPAYSVSGNVKLDLEHGIVMRLRSGGQEVWLQANARDEAFELKLGGSVVSVAGAAWAWDAEAVVAEARREEQARQLQINGMRAAYANVMAQLGVA